MDKVQELKPLDLSEELRPYEDKWVALSSDKKKVVGCGSTLEQASEDAFRKGSSKPIFLKVPRFDVGYIPITL